MAAQLTPGVVVALSEHVDGNGTLQPMLQVVDVRMVNNVKSSSAERFRMVLSDGVYTMQSMLATAENTRVLDGSIQKGSVIHLKEFTCSTIENRSGSMELEYEIFPSVSMDLRRRLLALYNTKFAMRGDDQWRATDPSVLTRVQRMLQVAEDDLSIDKIKEHVIAMEYDVKLDMAQVKKISEDRDTYLAVFNYVTPDFVQDSPTEPPIDGTSPTDIVASEPHSRKKMKMTCNPDCSTNSCQSDSSIGENFSKLLENNEIAIELFKGPLSMENCTDKVTRCGFKRNELHSVLKLLRLNWEHRQIFMKLEDSAAKDYALEAIYGFVPPSA